MKLLGFCLLVVSLATASPSKSKSKAKPRSKATGDSYACDPNQDLPKKGLALRLHDSEKFKSVYTGLYSDQQISIQRICEYLNKCEFSNPNVNDSEVRAGFMRTGSGQAILTQLENLRGSFEYSSVDSYLMDDHELNRLGNSKVTHKYKKADRTYFLNEKQVVGYLDQVGDEGVLTRLAGDCQAQEIVSFSNLELRENNIRMILNKKYCTTVQNKGPNDKLTSEDIEQMGAFFLNLGTVEDQLESQQLCEYWVPRPEPMGMVITADEPSKAKGKSKATKLPKKKKPTKSKTAPSRSSTSTVR